MPAGTSLGTTLETARQRPMPLAFLQSTATRPNGAPTRRGGPADPTAQHVHAAHGNKYRRTAGAAPAITSYSTRQAWIALQSAQAPGPPPQRGPCTGVSRGAGTSCRIRCTSTASISARCSRTMRARRCRSSCRGRRPCGSGAQWIRLCQSSSFTRRPPARSANGASARSPGTQRNPRSLASTRGHASAGYRPNIRRRRVARHAPAAAGWVVAVPSSARACVTFLPPQARFELRSAPLPGCSRAARAARSCRRRSRQPPGCQQQNDPAERREPAVAAFSGRPGPTGHYSAGYRRLTWVGFAGRFCTHVAALFERESALQCPGRWKRPGHNAFCGVCA